MRPFFSFSRKRNTTLKYFKVITTKKGEAEGVKHYEAAV
jgi:hypothetical protein